MTEETTADTTGGTTAAQAHPRRCMYPPGEEVSGRGEDQRNNDGYDGYDGYDYPLDRVVEIHVNRTTTVGYAGKDSDHVEVKVSPTCAKYQTKVKWTPDSGAPKTMLSDKHFGWIMAKNPDVTIRRTIVKLRPYSTGKIVPLLGVCDMWLTNEANKTIRTEWKGNMSPYLGSKTPSNWGSSK